MIEWIAPAALSLIIPAMHAEAQVNVGLQDVPVVMRGVWGKQGRCDVSADRLTITSRTAGWGDGPFDPVQFGPEDKAIFWNREYTVDNFITGRNPDILIHNTLGFHMPGQEGYARCGPNLDRIPWPPKPIEDQ